MGLVFGICDTLKDEADSLQPLAMGTTTSRVAVGVKSAVFATLYVMLEASDEPHKPTAAQWATAIFQLLLDVMQVLLSTADLDCHTGTS
jgi:hypothetical protein